MLVTGQKKFLRTLAHDLQPCVWIGQHGLTGNVLVEINHALLHHELIKIKIRAGDRGERDRIAAEVIKQTGAEKIQKTGNIVALYRENPEQPRIKLPRVS